MQKQTPQVFIVEASAGSGKTYALAKRYLKLLIDPEIKTEEIPFKAILAITFTNKAAIEMKERILKFLKEIAFGRFKSEDEKNEILKYLGVKQDYAAKKSFKVMDEIIKNYNFFQVQTIDSFINAILSGCAFKLNLSADFKIKNEYQDYLVFALDKLIDRARYDKGVMSVFQDYLKQYLYLENKSGWFPKKDILSIISVLFDDSNVYGAEFKKSDLQEKNGLFLHRKRIISLMQKLLENEPEGANQVVFKGIRNKLSKYADSLQIDEISKSFASERFPVKKNFSIPSSKEKLWQQIRREINELFESEAFSLFNCYIDIFNLVYKDLIWAASQDDVVFLTELNRKARILFEEDGITPPELYYRLATRFRHYLIDEFQDTSSLQWQNLFLMVEEALSYGGTLFYVGDKKQAIYRFRGGNVSLFDDIEKYFKNFPTSRDHLKNNYRSRPEIVEFNNQIFSQSNLKNFLVERQTQDKEQHLSLSVDEMQEVLSAFADCAQQINKEKPSGYVNIEKIRVDSQQECKDIIRQKLIGLIGELKNRFQDYGSIAVLCRRNRDIEEITGWLLAQQIPVESEKTLNIKQHPLVKEIISFLQFLNSPIDNLSFASFLLGEAFIKATGLKKSQISDFLFQIRKMHDKTSQKLYLYRQFRDKYPGIWDGFIDEFFKNVGFVPLYEFVVSILGKYEVARLFPEYQGFIMKFLELIKQRVDEENDSLFSFLEYFQDAPFEDLYVNVAQANAVKIMSIHKAKGLGFPVVIIPFLEINVEVSSGRDRKPYCLYQDQGKLKLLKLSKAYLSFSKFLANAYKQEYKKNLIDELNSVYVSFTRPQNELYAFIPKKSANSFNLANILIPDDFFERGSKVIPDLQERKAQDSNIMPASEYKNWIPYLKDEFIDKSKIDNRRMILEGEVIHSVLSFIGSLSDENKEAVLSDALASAQLLYPHFNDFKSIKNKLKELLDSQAVKPLFYLKEEELFREKEVVDCFGATRRIDRLIVKKEEVWIIDYKSSKQNRESSYSQLKDYISLVKDLYPDKRALGFLVYLDELTMEKVDE